MDDMLFWHAYSLTLEEREKHFIHLVVIYAECTVPPVEMPVVVEETLPFESLPEGAPEELGKYLGEAFYMTYETSWTHEPNEEEKFRVLPQKLKDAVNDRKNVTITINGSVNRKDSGWNPSMN